MTEISAEMAKLKSAIEKNRKEQQNLPTIENKVKELAAEITGSFSNICPNCYKKKSSQTILKSILRLTPSESYKKNPIELNIRKKKDVRNCDSGRFKFLNGQICRAKQLI